MIPNIGPMEIALVLGLALIVFGPKRLPGLGRSLGKGLSGFRREVDKIQDGTGQVFNDEVPTADEPERSNSRAEIPSS